MNFLTYIEIGLCVVVTFVPNSEDSCDNKHVFNATWTRPRLVTPRSRDTRGPPASLLWLGWCLIVLQIQELVRLNWTLNPRGPDADV